MSAVGFRDGAPVAARLVLAWVRFYTRDIDADTATTRRAELESDVWEQLNDADLGHGRESVFLLWRAARSVPADLSWRVAALRTAAGEGRSLFTRWEQGGLPAVLLTEGFVVSGLLAAVVLHLLWGGNAGSLGNDQWIAVALLAAAFAGALVGFWLLLQRATRWIGSLLVGSGSIALLVIGGHAMVRVSTTVAAIYYSTPFLLSQPTWSDLLHVSLAVLGLFHLSLALSLAPSVRRPRQEAPNR